MKFWRNVCHLPPFVSHVTCHISRDISHICFMSHFFFMKIYIVFIFNFFDTVVELTNFFFKSTRGQHLIILRLGDLLKKSAQGAHKQNKIYLYISEDKAQQIRSYLQKIVQRKIRAVHHLLVNKMISSTNNHKKETINNWS